MVKDFTILGIESSCDETAVAVVRSDKTVLSHALASQHDEHAVYGGVVPEIAARAHLMHINALIEKACADAKLTLNDVDAVAATTGPGLIGGVIVGAMVGKAIAASTDKPFIAINHLEAHALTARLTETVEFPYGLLLVSGGHCQILLVKGVGQYEQLGATRDDALGEAFDKCAKMMGLPYPGGPELEKAALDGEPVIALPKPMISTPGCDFSFSGLKTAVRLAIEANELNETFIANMAASFQQTVGDVLHDRLTNAIAMMPKVKGFVVAGGVAANQYLRKRIASTLAPHKITLHVPPMALCTDNAVMVAWAGVERFKLGMTDSLSVEPKARWPLVSLGT